MALRLRAGLGNKLKKILMVDEKIVGGGGYGTHSFNFSRRRSNNLIYEIGRNR